jgi:hypothetical protein
MKAIFLDIDGCLVTVGSMIHGNRLNLLGQTDIPSHRTFDPVAMSNLQYILEEVPGVVIVISSTWRKLYTLEELQEMFGKYNISPSFIVGVTPVVDSRHRGQEVALYLKHNPEITNFIIIDDDSDLAPFMDRLVKVDGKNGLTFSDAEKAIDKFKENDEKEGN